MFGSSAFNSGQQQQPQQPSNIFGAQTQQPPTSGFAGFGANTAPQQPQQQTPFGQSGLGAFGQPTQAAQQNPFGSSTFGQQVQQAQGNQAAQPSNSIFGAKSPSAGLFGGATSSSIGATSAAPSTNVFGSAPQPPANPGGLFGSSTNQTTGAPTQSNTGLGAFTSGSATNQGASLFGSARPAATTPSIFGPTGSAPTINVQQPQGSLFAQPKPVQPTSTLGQSTFAAPSSSQQGDLTRQSKFNDLSDQQKQQLEFIDSTLQKQIQISQELKSSSFGTEPERVSRLIHQVGKATIATANTLGSDEAFVKDLKLKVEQVILDTRVMIRIVDTYANPQQSGSFLQADAEFPLEFFARLAQQMSERMQQYKILIEQIERKLLSSAEREQYSPQAIAASLRAQNTAFMALAGKAAEVHQALESIKNTFRSVWRSQTGSARDPFDDREGVESLNLNALGVA